MATGTEILLLAGTVASGFAALSITRGLRMKDDKRLVAEWLWYAGGLVPLAAVCLFWASTGDQLVAPQRLILFVLGAAIGGFGLLAAGEWVRPIQAQAQDHPGTPLASNTGPNINTWNQSGGTNTINIGHQRLTFQPSVAEEILRRLPKDKPIVIHSVGGASDQGIASEYQQYLQGQGVKIAGRSTFGVKIPPPDYAITIEDRGENVLLTINPSVLR